MRLAATVLVASFAAARAACDSWVFDETPQLAAFERCRRVASPPRWTAKALGASPPGLWPRWVHVQGTQLLISRGAFRGAVFQHVYKTGGTTATNVLRAAGRGTVGGSGNPLRFAHLDANHSRAATARLGGCWPAAPAAPAPVVAFVREPLDRFFSGYYETLAREVARGPNSKKHDRIDEPVARSVDAPPRLLDAWIRARGISNATTSLNAHVGLQTWFLAYNTRLADQNFRVAALWDSARLDDVFAAVPLFPRLDPFFTRSIRARRRRATAAPRTGPTSRPTTSTRRSLAPASFFSFSVTRARRFALNRSDVSDYAWRALCPYLLEDYVCLAYPPPPECVARGLWPSDADVAARLRPARRRSSL